MICTYYGEKVFKVNQHDVLLCQLRRSMHNGKKVKKGLFYFNMSLDGIFLRKYIEYTHKFYGDYVYLYVYIDIKLYIVSCVCNYVSLWNELFRRV